MTLWGMSLQLFEVIGNGAAGGDQPLKVVYFVETNRPIDGQAKKVLHAVLSIAKPFIANSGFFIVPRAGTVSPWSSKASDILRRCGVRDVGRIERGYWLDSTDEAVAIAHHDKMVEAFFLASDTKTRQAWWEGDGNPADDEAVALGGEDGSAVLSRLNEAYGLALSPAEQQHLLRYYAVANRLAKLAELMMFAQANSEHCRHKIFRAVWQGGDSDSLMSFIRATHAHTPQGTVVAFNDNAAVVESVPARHFCPDSEGRYRHQPTPMHTVIKAETHNHPTAIEPFAGAATGNGGEIRDEAAAGRGAKTVAGFAGYIVSHLDGLVPPTARVAAVPPPPSYMASPLDIMIKAPLGASTYNNEFGRPNLAGFFRSFQGQQGGRFLGYHKPVMLAGGVGRIAPEMVGKKPLPVGAKIIQLGGPGFKIGMGGGAASSKLGGENSDLDFASVQRDNAEMQRRAQCVIDGYSQRADNPILSLHDVGAGGLANAIAELVHDAERGARIDLQAVPQAQKNMSVAEIWCNESQERYVLAMLAADIESLSQRCQRENCPYAVLGEVTAEKNIVVINKGEAVVQMPLAVLLEPPSMPPLQYQPSPPPPPAPPVFLQQPSFSTAVLAILKHPNVGNKRFLISIGDRTVGGLTARDQLVGPWQIAVADNAIVNHDFIGNTATTFAVGERPLADNAPASVRLAIAEALLNLAASECSEQPIKLSANWMANGEAGARQSELRQAVRAAAEFCMALGVSIVVGKDSLSMKVQSAQSGKTVESPVTAVITAVGEMPDSQRHWTPQLSGQTDTYLLRLAAGGQTQFRVGGSTAEQVGVFSPDSAPPDITASSLNALWQTLKKCQAENWVLSYHDVSDGGAMAALVEMALCSRQGLDIFVEPLVENRAENSWQTDNDHGDNWALKASLVLLSEEPSCIVEVHADNLSGLMSHCQQNGVAVQTIARPQQQDLQVRVYAGGKTLLNESLNTLWAAWDNISYNISAKRDDATCARQEHQRDFANDEGLFATLPEGGMSSGVMAGISDFPAIATHRPQVAIIREQGSNGYVEMAAAFTQAGYDSYDITITDLLHGHKTLHQFQGMALCGGFSFGDVLGSGRGWGMSILHQPILADAFSTFFAKQNTFALGICNGCQAMSYLQVLMPDSADWMFPTFTPNVSRRFEARFSLVEILPSSSLWLDGMAGLRFPIVSSHAEGRAGYPVTATQQPAPTVLRFIDNNGNATEHYPANPNGSAGGANGFCSPDGRVLIMMPHPDRSFRTNQLSWQPPAVAGQAVTPWSRLFYNSRLFSL